MVELLERVENFTGTNTAPDSIRWRHNEDGHFLVNRVYNRGLSEMTGSFKGPLKKYMEKHGTNKGK